MFSRHPFLHSLLTCLLICLQASHTQAEGKISLRFVSFPKSQEPVKVQLRTAADKVIDIEAPSKWLSPPVMVDAIGAWAVGETVGGRNDKPVFKELGRTAALASPDQILLLMRKGNDNAHGFDMVALDARVKGFGPGKYLFMNACMVDIAGVVGDEKFVLKSRKHTILEPKIPKNEHTFHTSLYFRKGNEAKPFFSSEWRISDNARTFIFFYHDPQTTHVRLHSITDYIPRADGT